MIDCGMAEIANLAPTLRPITDGDRFRVRRWLREPHVAQWFGSRGAAEAAVTLAEQSQTALVRIIEHGGVAIGYAHALDIGDAQVPPGAWTADVFIGVPEWRGRGLGAQALALLARDVFATTLATGLNVRVAVRNEAAVRAIEKAGFKWRSVGEDALLGPCWLMVMER